MSRLGNELKEFIGAFGTMSRIGNERRRTAAYEKIADARGAGGGPSPSAINEAYKQKYGTYPPGAAPTILQRVGSFLNGGSGGGAPGAVQGQDTWQGSLDPNAGTTEPDYPAGDTSYGNTDYGEGYADGGVVQGFEEGGPVEEPIPQTVAPGAPPVVGAPETMGAGFTPDDVRDRSAVPYVGVPQFGDKALPDRGDAVPTRAAPAAPKSKRKALNDQTRTEAYDPVLDKDDPDNMIRLAINGAMDYANETFHLKGTPVDAIGTPDPHSIGGRAAFLKGVGAASEQDIQQISQIAAATAPDKRLLGDPNVRDSIVAIRRLGLVYEHYVNTGQTDKANKAAFEIVQYSAGKASEYGGQALQALKAGDEDAAKQLVAKAYSQVPDGNHMVISPDGKTAIIRSDAGKPVQQFPIDGKTLMNAALGLSNKSLFWEVLHNRANMVGKQNKPTSELDKARIENLQARTAAVKKKLAGGGTAAAPAPNPMAGVVGDLQRATGVAPGNPNQGEVESPAASPAVPQAEQSADPDVEATGSDAPPDLKNNLPPASVLRLNAPTRAQGTGPAPSEALSSVTPAGKSEPFNPDGGGYDEASAKAAGLKPDETGHWPSRVPETGMLLKGRGHETFAKTIEEENKRGYQVFKGKDGRYYSIMDNEAVPNEIIHDGKKADIKPFVPPKYDEPHPQDGLKGTPYEGKGNPFSKVLQDEGFRKWVSANSGKGGQGKQELARIQNNEKEYNAKIAAWEKGKKAFEKEHRDAYTKEYQASVAEAKRVFDRSLTTRELQELPDEINTHAKAIAEGKGKDGKVRPSIWNAPEEVAKPEELKELATNLFTSNRNMTPGMAARIVAELTTPGSEQKERQFMPRGKDRADNVVVRLKNDDTVDVHIRPGAYRKINALTERYRAHLLKEREKPPETNYTGQVLDGAGRIISKLPDYLANRNLDKGEGSLADTGRMLTYPARKLAEGAIDLIKRARDNKDQGYNPPPLY